MILADASKSCQITKKIRLVLTVNSGLEGVKDFSFSSFYSVLPGLKHDIIIGLPTLLCESIDLYVALRAPDQMVSESIHSISAVTKVKPATKSKKTNSAKGSDIFSSSVLSANSPRKRGPLFHDSINKSKGLRKKFIAHGDDKPIYPDSEEEVDDRLLEETLPLPKRLAKLKSTTSLLHGVIPEVVANKVSPPLLTKQIFGSESDEFLDVHSPQSSARCRRADLDGVYEPTLI